MLCTFKLFDYPLHNLVKFFEKKKMILFSIEDSTFIYILISRSSSN